VIGRMSDQNLAMKRCYWRSRRGLLELDLLLPPFVMARYESLTERQRVALHELLDRDDPDIWDWLRSASVPDSPELMEVVALICAFNADSAQRTSGSE
jgi:antitoxin CptB